MQDCEKFIKIVLLLFRNTRAAGWRGGQAWWSGAMRVGLNRLLRPKSIAVIGGGSWCRNVIEQSRRFGFAGPIWPVHPSKSDIAGEVAYASIKALPGAPDASFIGINRHATIGAVAALAARGAGGAVCFASGFLEARGRLAGAAALHRQLLRAAGDMTLLGPNCYGFINYLDGALLWPDVHGGQRVGRGVAIITQSSNIAINITMQRRGLPIGYLVTVGNQAQTGLGEIGAALLNDARITALGLHIEGVGDIRALEALADLARDLGKPVIALKVGQSQQARAATISHSASIAGHDAGAQALLRRLGIARVETLPEFLEALKLLHVLGPLASNRIAAMSCSGGEAALVADLAAAHGVRLPPLREAQKNRLRGVLGPMVKLANPLDYHTGIWGDAARMADTFSAMVRPDLALGLLVADFPRADRCDGAAWDCAVQAMTATRQRTDRRMAIAATLPENMPEDMAQHLADHAIAPLCGLQEAMVAIRVGAECGRRTRRSRPVLLPRSPAQVKTLDEIQAKAAMAACGLAIPRSRHAADAAKLPGLAGDLGFPLVLKGAGVAHKTEAGLVALDLRSADCVAHAARAMGAQTYLLEEMITGIVAELLIGVVLDAAHGYVLTLGAGGTLAEIMDDTAALLVPATRADIQTALRGLKIFTLLNGYRGQARADLKAIVDATLSIQAYVVQNHGRVEEVEVNPLLCLPERAIAADALIRIGEIDD
jgi:acyl-CoA synthetase (NDP forming)